MYIKRENGKITEATNCRTAIKIAKDDSTEVYRQATNEEMLDLGYEVITNKDYNEYNENYKKYFEVAPKWFTDRVNTYPPMNEQMDYIFHNGLEGWDTFIQDIKDTYPKTDLEQEQIDWLTDNGLLEDYKAKYGII